jgi:hypothetical protein
MAELQARCGAGEHVDEVAERAIEVWPSCCSDPLKLLFGLWDTQFEDIRVESTWAAVTSSIQQSIDT